MSVSLCKTEAFLASLQIHTSHPLRVNVLPKGQVAVFHWKLSNVSSPVGNYTSLTKGEKGRKHLDTIQTYEYDHYSILNHRLVDSLSLRSYTELESNVTHLEILFVLF